MVSEVVEQKLHWGGSQHRFFLKNSHDVCTVLRECLFNHSGLHSSVKFFVVYVLEVLFNG
jgi:hypothetical protein